MISREVFFGQLEDVAMILGRKIDTHVTEKYYDMMEQRFTDSQWKRICSAAKMECKMFPRPAELIALGENMGFRQERASIKMDQYYAVECRCGETFAIDRTECDMNQQGRTVCWECEHVIKWSHVSAHNIGGFFSLHPDWRPLWDGTAKYDPVTMKDLFTRMSKKMGVDQAARDSEFKRKQDENAQYLLKLEEEKKHGDAFEELPASAGSAGGRSQEAGPTA